MHNKRREQAFVQPGDAKSHIPISFTSLSNENEVVVTETPEKNLIWIEDQQMSR